MILNFHDMRIEGILAILPEKESFFDDEISQYTFPEQQTKRLKKIMGYNKHRLAKLSTSTSDLCTFGLKRIIDKHVKKSEIGALIVVTVTPDHFIPNTSNIIQKNLDLPNDVFCVDIMQGCTGFIVGLMEAFLLLEKLDDNKKIILCNADVLSHKVSLRDRNSFPITGDAATITVIGKSNKENPTLFNIKMDGARGDALRIPAGGSRLPCSEETSVMIEDDEGNIRSLDNLVMEGSEVFQFVQKDVPPLINDTLSIASIEKEDIDWFLFHQPNKFMLEKLADRIPVPREKVPMNVVENYGNPSGASIPLATVHNLGKAFEENEYKCCLSAFGAGLSWGAVTTNLGNMKFCDFIISDL